MTPTIDFPEKLRFLFQPHRYKVAFGGRGGAKSWGFARALLLQAAQRKLRILCARELQLSIQDSVHKLLSEQIISLGLEGSYQVQNAIIRGHNGSEFVFAGIRSNITKIKSMEGIDIVWVEEAETVSAASWDVLIPTIRKAGSEIWVSFNPREELDPTYQRFVINPPPGAKVVEINWSDNPWFADTELAKEKDYAYSTDPEAADHVWGGKTRKVSEAQILRGRYVVEPFEPKPEWHGPYYGADWGFATDPTTLIRAWIHTEKQRETDPTGTLRSTLYIEHEAYGVGVELDDTPELFDKVPDGRKHVIRADNARPETISHLQRHGYPTVTAVEKWPGSVEDGVAHLRSYQKIVIHPRCVHTAEEARLYAFKTDRITGDVLPDIVDKHNHCIDALRYSLEPAIRQKHSEYGYTPAPAYTKPGQHTRTTSAGFKNRRGVM